METTVFEIELKDKRVFRVFCENGTQKRKVIASCCNVESKIKRMEPITNGIHKTKQWVAIAKTI